MPYFKYQLATLTVSSFDNLIAAVDAYGESPLVGTIVCEFHLSKAQRRSLPQSIREKLRLQARSRCSEWVRPRPVAPRLAMPLAEKLSLTILEASELSGLSRQTVTRLFEHEPGVIVVERKETVHKRRFRTIRIPRAVYLRVLARHTL